MRHADKTNPTYCLAPGPMVVTLAWSGVLHAAATQEEVLKSINASVSESVDPVRLAAGAVMVIAVIVIATMLANRYKRPTGRPPTVNHAGRLFKEISVKLRLRPAQIRQLKALATEKGVDHPLTLILCPSLRTKAKTSEIPAALH